MGLGDFERSGDITTVDVVARASKAHTSPQLGSAATSRCA